MDDNKKIINLDKIEFLNNTPESYDEYEKYAKILSKTIANKKVKNVGIVGPYGSGKSSLIQKFIEEEKKNNLEIENNIITVSLATYNSIIKKNRESSIQIGKYKIKREQKNEDQRQERDIEKSILQQLFYKNDNKNTKYSRFVVLKDKTKENIILSIAYTLILVGIVLLTLVFSNTRNRLINNIRHHIFIIVLIFMITSLCVGFLIFHFVKSKQIKSIQLGNISFEKNNSDEISIFNKYIDEILYFFQQNDYKILIIEDLDRFVNLNIFSKLKELNTLLNNNESIIKKHGKITFIYAVKDSMFEDEEERSKFFEFILPIIPSLTRDNVKDELEKNMSKIIHMMPISNSLVIDICDYIENRRVLNNIINDFIIHLAILQIDLSNNDSCNKLFSLMVLKNIFPLEYENLQKQDDKSIIYRMFNTIKKETQKNLLVQIDEEIKQLKQLVIDFDEDFINDFNILKTILVGCINKEGYLFDKFKYELQTFEKLEKVEFYYVVQDDYYRYNKFHELKLSNIEEKNFNEKGFFYKKERIIKNKQDESQKKINDDLQQLIKYRDTILNMSFYELYNLLLKKGQTLTFDSDLIKMLLVNGYIDESHMDYLSTHDNSFTTKNDKEIIKKVNKKEHIGNLTKIDNTEKVILSLNKSRFSDTYLINYYIYYSVFLEKIGDSIIKSNIVSCLKNNVMLYKDFLEDVISPEYDYKNLIIEFSKEIDNTWELIYRNKLIDLSIKKKIFINLINSCSLNTLKKLNINSSIQEVIHTISNFGNEFKAVQYTIKEFNDVFNIRIERLNEFIKNNNNTFLLKNSCFKLSCDNIIEILKIYYKFEIDDVLSRNYDLICNDVDEEFFNYIEDNINVYVEEVYNKISSSRISSENFHKLLTCPKLEVKLKEIVATKESETIEYFKEIDSEVLNILISKRQIKMNLEQIIDEFDEINKDQLISYIDYNLDTLNFNSKIISENKVFEEFLFENIALEKIVDKLEKNYYKNLNIRNIDNIITLIDNDCCKYSRDDYKKFIINDKILDSYHKRFSTDIKADLLENNIILSVEEKVRLYRFYRHRDNELFEIVIKKFKKEEADFVVATSAVDEFINNISDFSILSYECKDILLEQDINEEKKEIILISYKNINPNELREKISKIFRLNGKKYEFKNMEFYSFVRNKGIVTMKKKNIIYFK